MRDLGTLGGTLYHAGDWKGSVAALERSMALQPAPKGGDPGQWFCLAMDHWQLGNTEEARRWFGVAVSWMDKTGKTSATTRRIRAEAAALLGIDESK